MPRVSLATVKTNEGLRSTLPVLQKITLIIEQQWLGREIGIEGSIVQGRRVDRLRKPEKNYILRGKAFKATLTSVLCALILSH